MGERTLYYGDNLDILRNHLAAESVDLIYLDPPFNSQADYNLLFREETGELSPAQIRAFTDYWHWDQSAETTYRAIIETCPPKVSTAIEALRKLVGSNSMMAYLVMMALRLVELRRVLKPTGSIYLHCDDVAVQYLRLILDCIFTPANFRNEIIWQRTNAHNTANRYGRNYDIILFYSKSPQYTWNSLKIEYSDEQMKRYRSEGDRSYTGQDLTAPRPNSNSGKFEWRGTMPSPGRGWGYTLEQLEEWWEQGLILKRKDGTPRMDGLKVYLDEMPGKPLQAVWTDISRIANTSSERMGFQTQKPIALLERIISASSNKGELVLDPFCGCGTAVVAAEKLGRQWIGIDITHLAMNVMKKRLRESFPRVKFKVVGEPEDVPSARALAEQDRYQFQWWALSLIGAMPVTDDRKKGADEGIDGLLSFVDGPKGKATRVIVQVKSGGVGAKDIRDLKGTMGDEALGLFITLEEPTQPMQTEAVKAGFYKSEIWQRDFPRLQILTIEQLLAGQKPHLPGPTAITKKAPRVLKHKQPKLEPRDD